MTLSFKYKKVKRPNNREIKSPSIPITLTGNGGRYTFMALVDSGADISTIPYDVAEWLGLDLNGEKEEVVGIGGRVPAFQASINIEISKGHEMHNFSIPIKVIFNNTVEMNGLEMPVLLSRAGFFDKFIVTFNQREERVILKKIQDNQ